MSTKDPTNGAPSSPAYKEPYDRGWAWMTVVGCCLMNFLIVGNTKSSGLLFVEYLEVFKASTSATSLIFTMLGVTLIVFSPVATCLGSRYSYRLVVMVGGLLTCLGYIGTAFATSLLQAIFSHGVLAGTGQTLCYATSYVVVNQYFRGKLALANGISVAGSSIGEFVLPPLIHYLLEQYTFRGALLILGGLMLNLIVVGALYRPLSFSLKHRIKTVKEGAVSGNAKPEDSPEEHGEDLKEADSKNLISSLRESSKSSLEKINMDKQNSIAYEISSTGSLHAIPNNISVYQDEDATRTNHPPVADGSRAACCSRIIVCDFSICRSLVFHIAIFGAFLCHFGYMNTFFFIPAFAKEINTSQHQVAFMLSMGGVAGFVGRLGCGFVANLRLIRSHYLLISFLVLMAVSSIACPEVRTYESLFVYCILLGLLGGCYMAILPTVVTDFLGAARVSAAFGFMATAFGISMTIGPIILSLIEDSTGSFANGLYMCAASHLLGAALFLLYPCARKWEEQHVGNTPETQDTSVAL